MWLLQFSSKFRRALRNVCAVGHFEASAHASENRKASILLHLVLKLDRASMGGRVLSVVRSPCRILTPFLCSKLKTAGPAVDVLYQVP
jgi:hypothetical protein